MRTARALLALAIGVAAAVPASAAAKPESWTEAHSAHFHVVTNANPKAAANSVHKLEEFRHLLSLMFPGMRLDPPTPARVILFRNNRTFEPYTPRVTQEKRGRLGGFMQPGDERMYLAINLGLPEPQHVVFHEYIHLILALNMDRVPTWLNEGLAEFYEQSEVDGVNFTIGNWQPGWWQVLQQEKPIPLAALVQRDYNVEPFKDQKEMGLFYAQSWLLVHYLMVADEGKRRPQFVEFVRLLMQGVDQDQAFTQALGTDYAGMEKQLRDYLSRTTLHVYRGTMAQAVKRTSLPFSPMAPAVAEAYLTDLWFNRGDVARAEQALQTLAQSGAPPPEVLDRLGRVALRQGRPLEAEKHLEAALAARPNDLGLAYYTAWAISQGRMGRAGDEDENRAAATRVIELLSPHLDAISTFPHAYHLLISARMARGDPPAELVPVVERARAAMPTAHEFDLLLAHLYEREERWDDAEKLLIEAVLRAEDPEERQRAEQMLDSLQRRREYQSRPPAPIQVALEGEAPIPTGPPVNVRDPVEPPPASTPSAAPEVRYIRGTLVDVKCSDEDDSARIYVSLARKAGESPRLVQLKVRSRTRVILLGTTDGREELGCGPVDVPVAINYRLEAQGEEISGTVMTIEFNPPPPRR